MRLEALHQRLGVVVHTARSLAALQATLRHHLFRALQQQNEAELWIRCVRNSHIHLVADELVPSLQILHASGEAIDDDLLVALLLVVLSAHNDQSLLDVVVDQLGVLAAATRCHATPLQTSPFPHGGSRRH